MLSTRERVRTRASILREAGFETFMRGRAALLSGPSTAKQAEELDVVQVAGGERPLQATLRETGCIKTRLDHAIPPEHAGQIRFSVVPACESQQDIFCIGQS